MLAHIISGWCMPSASHFLLCAYRQYPNFLKHTSVASITRGGELTLYVEEEPGSAGKFGSQVRWQTRPWMMVEMNWSWSQFSQLSSNCTCESHRWSRSPLPPGTETTRRSSARGCWGKAFWYPHRAPQREVSSAPEKPPTVLSFMRREGRQQCVGKGAWISWIWGAIHVPVTL